MEKETFSQFMDLMKQFMKLRGFTKKNSNFYKRHEQGNIGIINFQKDRFGSRFTINVSVYSRALAEFFLGWSVEEKEVKKYPSEWNGHWRASIDSLVPEQSFERRSLSNSKIIERDFQDEFPRYDWWWRLSWWGPNYTSVEIDAKELFDEISPLIDKFAIPAIDQRITDEKLKNLWLSYENFGGEELAVLLMLSGETEKLKIVLNKLIKDVLDPSVSDWLKADYDRIVKASGLDKEGFNLSGVVNFPPGQNSLSKEELLALYDSLRTKDSADFEAKCKAYEQLLSKVIKLATPPLESQGFIRRKRSDEFCKHYATGDVGIISFKRENLKFSVIPGIYSRAGAAFGLANYEREIITDPKIDDCHWSVDNITSLDTKQSIDYEHNRDPMMGHDYWKYKDTTDIESLSHKIVHLITKFAVPIIEHLVANPEFHDAVVSKLKKMNDMVKYGI